MNTYVCMYVIVSLVILFVCRVALVSLAFFFFTKLPICFSVLRTENVILP